MTPKMISPEELNDNFDNVRSGDWSLVDVRDAFDYRAAHIPMAALMPSGYTENMIGQVNPDNVVVLYCKPESEAAEKRNIFQIWAAKTFTL